MLSTKQLQKHNFVLGSWGERRALFYLQKLGYEIWGQNVRFKNHEADVIAFDSEFQEIVFAEVKTRRRQDLGHPSEAVDFKKLKSLKIIAEQYVRRRKLKFDYRFDIIAVVGEQVEHFKNVTWT